MIQLSPQSNGVDSLKPETGVQQKSTKKTKTGFAKLFSTLLSEAKALSESGRGEKSKPAVGDGAKAKVSLGKNGSLLAGKKDAAVLNDAAGKATLAAKDGRKKTKGNGEGSEAGTPSLNQSAQNGALHSSVKSNADGKAVESENKKKSTNLSVDGASARSGLKKTRRDDENVALAASALSVTAGVGRLNKDNASDAAKGEVSDKRAEAANSKKTDKRKERIELAVYDHRSATPSSADGGNAVQATDASASTGDKNASADAEFVVSLHNSSGDAGKSNTTSTQGTSGSFSNLLARELRENLNADIVKHASVVLKDGGAGLIRLSLKPDSLGAVKIRLEMADNRIAGHILVESDDALKAFEREIASLEQAFRDGGFDGASLELAVSADGGRGSQGNPRGGDDSRPFFSERFVASTYDGGSTSASSSATGTGVGSDSVVNVLA